MRPLSEFIREPPALVGRHCAWPRSCQILVGERVGWERVGQRMRTGARRRLGSYRLPSIYIGGKNSVTASVTVFSFGLAYAAHGTGTLAANAQGLGRLLPRARNQGKNVIRPAHSLNLNHALLTQLLKNRIRNRDRKLQGAPHGAHSCSAQLPDIPLGPIKQ
jgi:hypothetical protein